MTKEQTEALRKKWEINGGKVVDVSHVEKGINLREFIESLTYSKTPDEHGEGSQFARGRSHRSEK